MRSDELDRPVEDAVHECPDGSLVYNGQRYERMPDDELDLWKREMDGLESAAQRLRWCRPLQRRRGARARRRPRSSSRSSSRSGDSGDGPGPGEPSCSRGAA